MIGTRFRQPHLDPGEKKSPVEILYILDDTIQWGYWKVQPVKKNPSNKFMFTFYEVGEGSYDTITVPFDVLIACADFSDEYLCDSNRKDNPIVEWLKADWQKVRAAVYEAEAAALKKWEETELKEFFRLIRTYGPKIVSGEITREQIMEGADMDKYFYNRFLTAPK